MSAQVIHEKVGLLISATILANSELRNFYETLPGNYAGLEYRDNRRHAFQGGMGLSFFVLQKEAFRVVGHTGSQKAFRTFIYVHPESRTGCIAAFNTVVSYQDEAGVDHSPSDELFTGLEMKFFENIFPLFTLE